MDDARLDKLYGPGNQGSDAAPASVIEAVVHGDFLDAERQEALLVGDRQVADAIRTAGNEVASALSGLGISRGAAKAFIARVRDNFLHPPANEAQAEIRRFAGEEAFRRQHQHEAGTRLTEARALLASLRSAAPRFSAYLQNTGAEDDPELLSLLSEIARARR